MDYVNLKVSRNEKGDSVRYKATLDWKDELKNNPPKKWRVELTENGKFIEDIWVSDENAWTAEFKPVPRKKGVKYFIQTDDPKRFVDELNKGKILTKTDVSLTNTENGLKATVNFGDDLLNGIPDRWFIILKKDEEEVERVVVNEKSDWSYTFKDISQKDNFEITQENPYKTLYKYGRNITEQFRRTEEVTPIIGRDVEIRRTTEILSAKGKNNAYLLGEAGVGKSALVEGVAQRIITGNIPDSLKGKEVFELDLASLTDKRTEDGGFTVRMTNLIEEIRLAGGKIITFIDEFHMIMGAAEDGGLDASNILKPALARGELHMIGATTNWEYKKFLEHDAALSRRFQVVSIEEPTVNQTVDILAGRRRGLESFHRVSIEDEALYEAARLSSRYMPHRNLPDKAIDVLDQAATATRLDIDSMPEQLSTQLSKLTFLKSAYEKEKNVRRKNSLEEEINKLTPIYEEGVKDWNIQKKILLHIQKQREALAKIQNKYQQEHIKGDSRDPDILAELSSEIQEKEELLKNARDQFISLHPMIDDVVDKDTILKAIETMTGIPVGELSESEIERLRNLEETIHKGLIGQDDAVKSVSNSIKRSRLGFSNPNKPIGSFLFLGPSGVGKTELAKVLSEQMFGTRNIFRLDMGSYKSADSITRLIGAPPGQDVHDIGGELTEHVKRNPYSLILLDELEKAHPDVYDVLLSLLEEGELRDSRGTVVNFRNTIIIMTTNLGAEVLLLNIDRKSGKLNKEGEIQIQALIRNADPSRGGRGFKPEFINRIDGIIYFYRLTDSEREEITRLKLEKLRKSALESQDIRVVYSKPIEHKSFPERGETYDVASYISGLLTDQEKDLGGRPIERYITAELNDEIVEMMLSEELKKGDNLLIDVSYKNTGSEFYIDERDGKRRYLPPQLTLKKISDHKYNQLLEEDAIYQKYKD